MASLLLVIDLQNAFINGNTVGVVKKINELLDEQKYDNVVFTRFVNTAGGMYVRKLNYRECISEESRRIVIDTRSNVVIDKEVYSAFNPELEDYLDEKRVGDVYLCGIDTECCVLKTALDLFEKGYNVHVLDDYCACMRGKVNHDNALEILKRTIGHDGWHY